MSAVAQSASLASARSAFSGSRKALSSTKTVRAARSVVAKAEVKEIHMPALSSTMTEGKIVSWLKGEGDAISKGDAVVVVESDKADMDVESFFDGYLAVIAVEDGEMAAVGAPIAFVAETEAEIDAAKAMAAAAGFPVTGAIGTDNEFKAALPTILGAAGPVFHNIKVRAEDLPLVMPPKDGVTLKDRFRVALLGEREALAPSQT